MKTQFRLLLFLFFPFASFLSLQAQQDTMLFERQPELKLPVVAKKALIQPTAIQTEARCSETELGAVEIEFLWEEEQKTSDQVRIDISIYKRGFEADAFTTIWPATVEGKCQALFPEKFGLKGVPTAMDLKVIPQPREMLNRNQRIILLTKEQGIYYYFRVLTKTDNEWLAEETIQIITPICAFDSK